MDKFTRTLRGYDPDEVNKFLDQVIVQVEKMNKELKEKDALIEKLKGNSNVKLGSDYSKQLQEKDALISKLNGINSKLNDSSISTINSFKRENQILKEKLAKYEQLEDTLNRAIAMAEKSSEQIRINANKEREMIIENAKNNANRIVNDALIKAENTEREVAMLKRNINSYKRRLKDIIEEQLRMVDEIEKVDL